MRRVVDRGGARVPEHSHDWPVLSLFVLGGYTNRTELGDMLIDAPSGVLYRAGARHQNTIAAIGFEQIEIEFDPDWLDSGALPDSPVSRWLDGGAAMGVRSLAQLCAGEPSELRLRDSLRSFLRMPCSARAAPSPGWVEDVCQRLRADPSVRINTLASELSLHPSWLGCAFKRATGESVLEYATRLRVERAARSLRETNRACAEIALDAGFCDQSHMSRSFQRLLRRSPTEVRDDRRVFRQSDSPRVCANSNAVSGIR